MARRRLQWYIVKIERISGWLLIPVVVTFLLTGYASCGSLGVERWLDSEAAFQVHRVMDQPLVVLFLVHVLTAGYLSMRRWGWIGKKNKTT